MTAILSPMHMHVVPPMTVYAQAHDFKIKVQIKQGSRSMDARGSTGHSSPWEGLVKHHPDTSKKGDNSIEPELKLVQWTSPWPQSQNRTANKSSAKYLNDTGSSLAESVHRETAPSLDSDSLDIEERGNNQGTYSKNSHSAHGRGFG